MELSKVRNPRIRNTSGDSVEGILQRHIHLTLEPRRSSLNLVVTSIAIERSLEELIPKDIDQSRKCFPKNRVKNTTSTIDTQHSLVGFPFPP